MQTIFTKLVANYTGIKCKLNSTSSTIKYNEQQINSTYEVIFDTKGISVLNFDKKPKANAQYNSCFDVLHFNENDDVKYIELKSSITFTMIKETLYKQFHDGHLKAAGVLTCANCNNNNVKLIVIYTNDAFATEDINANRNASDSVTAKQKNIEFKYKKAWKDSFLIPSFVPLPPIPTAFNATSDGRVPIIKIKYENPPIRLDDY